MEALRYSLPTFHQPGNPATSLLGTIIGLHALESLVLSLSLSHQHRFRSPGTSQEEEMYLQEHSEEKSLVGGDNRKYLRYRISIVEIILILIFILNIIIELLLLL